MKNFYIAPKRSKNLAQGIAKYRNKDILYGHFFFNHLSHNTVVIGCSNFSDTVSYEKMVEWHNYYENKMHSGHYLDSSRQVTADMPIITSTNWKDFIGNPRRKYNYNYPAYLSFFDKEIREFGPIPTVQKYFPVISNGMAACAVHPVIHLGFGLEAMNDNMIAEGLASMCSIHHTIGSGFAKWTPESTISNDSVSSGIINSAIAYATKAFDDNLHIVAAETAMSDQYMKYDVGSFQRIVLAFDDESLPLGKSLDDMPPIILPDIDKPFTPAIVEATALMTAAYLASDCEFFYLHGLTSLHAVAVIIAHLDDPETQRQAFIHWWRTAMTVIVCQHVPNILDRIKNELQPWLVAHEKQANAGEENDYGVADEEFWKQSLEISLTSEDEHVSKAVFALWRWSQWNGIPSYSKELFKKAASNQLRAHSSGGAPHNNLWFAPYWTTEAATNSSAFK